MVPDRPAIRDTAPPAPRVPAPAGPPSLAARPAPLAPRLGRRLLGGGLLLAALGLGSCHAFWMALLG